MENPFIAIDQRFDRLEALFLELIKQSPSGAITAAANELLNVQQAAVFLDLAVPTIYAMVHRLELPFCKRSKRLYFTKTDLRNYVLQGRRKSLDEIKNDDDSIFVKPRKHGF